MQKLYRLHWNNKYAFLHTEVFICILWSPQMNRKLYFENIQLSHIHSTQLHFLSVHIYFVTCICRLGQLTLQSPQLQSLEAQTFSLSHCECYVDFSNIEACVLSTGGMVSQTFYSQHSLGPERWHQCSKRTEPESLTSACKLQLVGHCINYFLCLDKLQKSLYWLIVPEQ